jgi:hypothetical protein
VKFTNSNVSAYLYTLKYPNITSITTVKALSSVEISNDKDVGYLYIGSVTNSSVSTYIIWSKPSSSGGSSGGGNTDINAIMNSVSMLVSISLALIFFIM